MRGRRSGPGGARGSARPRHSNRQRRSPKRLNEPSTGFPILHAMLSWVRRRWPYLAALAALLIAGAVVVFLTFGQRPGDVQNADVPFTAPAPPPLPPPEKKAKTPQTVNW